MNYTEDSLREFQKKIWDYYALHKRIFTWRETQDPYRIVVSEIMLQQTQVERVKEKYAQWLQCFPDFESLASASLVDVLGMWQGLGYNRRGIALQKIAQKVIGEYNAILPDNPEILVTFPGIGNATAGSITAFAFNKPTVFIETNIRRVFIDHFFENASNVHDDDIAHLVALTVDTNNPREWYFALMDYGTMLKKTKENANHKSTHYRIQSKFEGSLRQLRGKLVRYFLEHKIGDLERIKKGIEDTEERIHKALDALVREEFLVQQDDLWKLRE